MIQFYVVKEGLGFTAINRAGAKVIGHFSTQRAAMTAVDRLQSVIQEIAETARLMDGWVM